MYILAVQRFASPWAPALSLLCASSLYLDGFRSFRTRLFLLGCSLSLSPLSPTPSCDTAIVTATIPSYSYTLGSKLNSAYMGYKLGDLYCSYTKDKRLAAKKVMFLNLLFFSSLLHCVLGDV
jgi:hypothetical protein